MANLANLHASVKNYKCRMDAVKRLARVNENETTYLYLCEVYKKSKFSGSNPIHEYCIKHPKYDRYSMDGVIRGIGDIPYEKRGELAMIEQVLLAIPNQKAAEAFFEAVRDCGTAPPSNPYW